MPVKRREKRFMTKQEKSLRDLMYKHDVKLADLAAYYDVTDQAIFNRLMALTPSTYQELEKVILEIADVHSPTKVAS